MTPTSEHDDVVERQRIMAELLALAEELETAPKSYLHTKDATDRTIALMDRANQFMARALSSKESKK